MKSFFIRNSKKIVYLTLVGSCFYGLGRLYYDVTGGFSIANITSDLAFSEDREVRRLSDEEILEMDGALNQPYRYFSKGCQSYVFLSDDNKYVIKFFKYQRFRIQPWLKPLDLLAKGRLYLDKKREKKENKLNFFLSAWKVAFNELKEESGLIYVHLNKTNYLNKEIVIFDKLGFKHTLQADDQEFLIQRKADMLQSYIRKNMSRGHAHKAERVLDDLVDMVYSEYRRGLSDQDHALMQNTGVYNDRPFHIDIGQFVMSESVKNPAVHHQEIYNKFFKFRSWLKKNYPELEERVTDKLKSYMGDQFHVMKPYYGRVH